MICELVAILKTRPETASELQQARGRLVKKGCVYNILNEGEIVALLAVSPYGRSLTRKHLARKFGEDSRILRCWILILPTHIEALK